MRAALISQRSALARPAGPESAPVDLQRSIGAQAMLRAAAMDRESSAPRAPVNCSAEEGSWLVPRPAQDRGSDRCSRSDGTYRGWRRGLPPELTPKLES